MSEGPIADAAVPGLRRQGKLALAGVWIFGILVLIPPVIGLVGTVVGMLRGFNELQSSGTADPEALANDISLSLMTTMWGIVVSVLSLVLFVACLVFYLLVRSRMKKLRASG